MKQGERIQWTFDENHPEPFDSAIKVIDYFEEENNLSKKLFNLEALLEFQLTHDIQIIRGPDLNYECWIDGKCYHTSLTPIHCMIIGVHIYKSRNS